MHVHSATAEVKNLVFKMAYYSYKIDLFLKVDRYFKGKVYFLLLVSKEVNS